MNAFYELEDEAFLHWVEETWGIGIHGIRKDLEIQGSPERSLLRAAVSDGANRVFILEKFGTDQQPRRHRINQALEHLQARGVTAALEGVKGKNGRVLNSHGSAWYQLTPFVAGTELERPQWLDSPDKGRNMARFWVEMKQLEDAPFKRMGFETFDIGPYIHGLFKDMENHAPDRARQYKPFLEFLDQGFMAARHGLRQTFCHGDFHPLNVIWQGQGVAAVIDWEFAGFKPDIYDAANLVGCAGIEHPQGLVGPMVMTFLHELKQAAVIESESWQWFLEYVLALRFAWLSEWLRKKDMEMLETEAAFMEILITHQHDLKEAWT